MSARGSVGVRELKDHASAILRRVRRGEAVRVTDRGRPVAILVPVAEARPAETLRQLVATGRLAWGGGKPKGVPRPSRVRGASVADAVIEDRR